ncbi:hypothetical protein Anas_01067 [Armadillidium nasatum]|uniref:NADP-dependent oxidoreductase domain-containing protein n=1 Tax=Armadillidium nasatum TaxID=96803 RepID=A0A5N5T882_9CRUS|nr:hypothetical protein Anas_01067 [Armadillidium nasatum]
MAPKVPRVSFSNGLSVPIIGLGTWGSAPGEVTTAVKEAISSGYRHIDCARVYGNEPEVGAGIKAKLQDGTIKREDLFVTTKLWLTDAKKEYVVPALKGQLKSLGLTYVDLYLVHWPVNLRHGDEYFPKKADGSTDFGTDYDLVGVWRGMEEAVNEGLAKSIGLSNYNKRQVETILKNAKVKPVTNQNVPPYFSQKKLISFCKSNGLTLQLISPLGSPSRPVKGDSDPVLLEDPVVLELAKKYNKNAGQILIRYQVFDFKLSSEDLKKLEDLNRNFRYLFFPYINGHPEYPFNEEY